MPGPENVPSGTEAKLHSSVDRCVAKDVNVASRGHCTNMDDLVSAEQCIENADVPLNTVERVAEEMVASACGEQNPLGKQYHTVTSSRSEHHINFLKHCRGSITDSACESQVLNMSAVNCSFDSKIS